MITFVTLTKNLPVDTVKHELIRESSGFEINHVTAESHHSYAHDMNRVMGIILNTPEMQDEWFVLIHDDCKLIDSARELYEHLTGLKNADPKVGVVGVVGCKTLTIDGRWWLDNDRVGRIAQGNTVEPNLVFKQVSSPEKVMSVDGCFMVIHRDAWQAVLGMDPLYGGYHYYDADLCTDLHTRGYNNYVINFLVQHLSGGELNADWERSQKRFQEKWQGKLSA